MPQSNEILLKHITQFSMSVFLAVGHIFSKGLHQKAQVLGDVELLYVSSPVVQDILCGSTASLLYRVDEDKLIAVVGLYPCCHKALQNLAKDQVRLILKVFSSFVNFLLAVCN